MKFYPIPKRGKNYICEKFFNTYRFFYLLCNKLYIMKKSKFNLFLFFFLALVVSSCLTVEKKEYTFELKDNHSGTLTIKYINIISMKDDTADISESDFDDLISTYLEGDQIENDYKDAVVISKRLFEEDGVLCGEVVIDFNDIKSVGLFQYDNKSPFMLNLGSFLDTESYLNSNGEFGGDVMPVVFWQKSLKTLTLTTYVNSPDETCVSLMDEYNNWK